LQLPIKLVIELLMDRPNEALIKKRGFRTPWPPNGTVHSKDGDKEAFIITFNSRRCLSQSKPSD
jgi:hypothetical protein